MNSTGISQFNQARVEWAIRLRYSPMPKLSMDLLAGELNAFRIGELRTVGKTWEVMMERDGELAINSEKRKADSACLEWQISSDGSPDGDKHAAALQYFYDNLSATKALDQDSTGGLDELVFQTLSAVDFYYSAHEILLRVDNPAAKEVTAEFRHTPIWFFEARRGYLGYLKHIFDMYGQPCLAGEWLTAVNTGWMRQLTMPYCAKWMSMRDWLLFGERYGSGFLEAITDATKDSQEWNDAQNVLNALANDGLILHNKGVELKFLEQPSRNQLPFQPVVELVDRLYAKCYRGVDLATGSRDGGAGGERGGGRNPVGASVQKEESGILLVRDAKWITGVFNDRIDRPILRYLFNEEPRAWFALLPPLDDTSSEDLQSLQTLVPMGLRVGLKEVYKRFRWSVPDPAEPCLESPTPNGQSPMPDNSDESNPDARKSYIVNRKSGNDSKLETQNPELTRPAQTADTTPIAAGADPARNPGLVSDSTPFNSAAVDNPRFNASSLQPFNAPSRQMPDTQVDAGAFWSRVGLAPRGADGQTLPMPSLGYAVPNAAPPRPSTLDPSLLDRHASLVARGLGNSRAAQALHREINRQRQAENTSLANDGFNPDEPRDKYGKWTAGSDATGSKTNSPPQTNMLAPEVARPVGGELPQNAYHEAVAQLGADAGGLGTDSPNAFTPKAFTAAGANPAQNAPPQTAAQPTATAGTPAKRGFFATIGTALQKAGEKVRDVVAAGEFVAVGDPQDALKQMGYTSDDLKRMGYKDVEEDSGTNGGKPFEQGMQMLPPVQHAIASGAEGIVVSSPKLAIAAVDPVAGAIAFGSTPQGFDPKQALIALVLPMAGKYGGEIVEGLATKLGVSSETALQIFKSLGGAAGITGALGLDQLREISKLPAEQQKQALIDAAGNLGITFVMGLLGGEEKPGETAEAENVRVKPSDIAQEEPPLSEGDRQAKEEQTSPQKPSPPPPSAPASQPAPPIMRGRLGSASTRQHIQDVINKLEAAGWTITNGGIDANGNRRPEEYIPGAGGARKGSSYPDITATKNGQTLRVNTIDTRADGVTPSTREARNAARIRSQKPNDTLILIPKP